MDFRVSQLRAALGRPVDAASLIFFRLGFGAIGVVLAVRFFTHGWIEADYVAPHHFFHYWGFGWVQPWPGVWMYLHYGVMAMAAACMALGLAYRPACAVFTATFTYAHLCDKSNYLNHYYLVSLLGLLLTCLPLDREVTLRSWLSGALDQRAAPRWALLILRFQVGVVYFFGGLAKLGEDWMWRAEPLRIWLPANAELPLLGRYFARLWVAFLFSWCGALFDLSVVPLLLWRKTRRLAYLMVLVFHVLTALLFKIGMFPWLMTLSATLFFDPSWPRRLIARLRLLPVAPRVSAKGAPLGGHGLALLTAYALVQLLMPLRHLLYPGNTLWTEEGFRFSWRVMLMEKSGTLDLSVVDALGRRTLVEPRKYLTPFQERMAVTQPDMILELSHIVARDFDARGVGPVHVYADSRVSFNGRSDAPLISPDVDLANEEDGLAPKPWILPAPSTPPEF